jgi:predicted aspartyl protease
VNSFDGKNYHPPAPIASIKIQGRNEPSKIVDTALSLIDTGADTTLLPRWAIEQLGITTISTNMKLQWYDGSVRSVETVEASVYFLGGRFDGAYPIIDQPHGIIGRDLMNYFKILLDGPNKSWERV